MHVLAIQVNENKKSVVGHSCNVPFSTSPNLIKVIEIML